MSTATHPANGHVARERFVDASHPTSSLRPSAVASLALMWAFAATVARYLLLVLPSVARQLSRWRTRTEAIPDRVLRGAAYEGLIKRGNIEGAALFATLAPRANRRAALRALLAFQMAYNYLDALSELPHEDPVGNATRLHQALIDALTPGAAHSNYHGDAARQDGGYLHDLIQDCQSAVGELPSYGLVAPAAQAAAARILSFQALNLSERDGGHEAMRRWASRLDCQDSGLAWWEIAAGAGSSLGVHALIAAAADPRTAPADAHEIAGAYFPWIGSLHSLLDSLVDRHEDQAGGRRSLLDYYESSHDTARRLRRLAARSRLAATRLPAPLAHRVVLTAMCSYYLSAPQCDASESHAVTLELRRALGPALSVAILMFRSRRRLRALTRRSYT